MLFFLIMRELETNNHPIVDDYLFPAPLGRGRKKEVLNKYSLLEYNNIDI